MTASIKTYFGDYLLGLWVTWKSTASEDNSGTTDINIHFQANLRAKLYVYAQGGDYTVGDYTADDCTNDWSLYEGSGQYVCVDYDATSGGTPSAGVVFPGDTTEAYHFYVAWQNPDSSGSVTYDGVEAKSYLTVTTVSDYSSETHLKDNPPTIEVKWMDNSTAG